MQNQSPSGARKERPTRPLATTDQGGPNMAAPPSSPPPARVQELSRDDMVNQFVGIAGCDFAFAISYLEGNSWNLEVAVSNYMDGGTAHGGNRTSQTERGNTWQTMTAAQRRAEEAKRQHMGTPLPTGWVREFDDVRKYHYYYNENTGISVWTRPGGMGGLNPDKPVTSTTGPGGVELVMTGAGPVPVGQLVMDRGHDPFPIRREPRPPAEPPSRSDKANVCLDDCALTCGICICWGLLA
eukprot:6277840-Prymnesium_polylepis.2